MLTISDVVSMAVSMGDVNVSCHFSTATEPRLLFASGTYSAALRSAQMGSSATVLGSSATVLRSVLPMIENLNHFRSVYCSDAGDLMFGLL